MNCPICQSLDHRVIDTVDRNNAIRRRRRCDRCKHAWTTWETSERTFEFDVDRAREHLAALEALIRPQG